MVLDDEAGANLPKSDPAVPLDDYVRVADRITLFYARYTSGRIITRLISQSDSELVFKALVYRSADDPSPAATGWAAERVGDGEINAVACLENTETSAVGRALANLGLTASRSRPSLEEWEKAQRARTRLATARSATAPVERRTASGSQDGADPPHAERALRRWLDGQADRLFAAVPPVHQTARAETMKDVATDREQTRNTPESSGMNDRVTDDAIGAQSTS